MKHFTDLAAGDELFVIYGEEKSSDSENLENLSANVSDKLPFCVKIFLETFQHLDQIISMVCEFF